MIYNRLYVDMPLQIDATVYYGQDRLDPIPRVAPDRHALQHVSPQGPATDTDRQPRPGLDPERPSILRPTPARATPVCQVLADPTTGCVYLFYVLANEDGGHAFAVTPEQHQANVDAAAAAGLL